MFCADPSLSRTTSRDRAAPSAAEPLPIKPIRPWRHPLQRPRSIGRRRKDRTEKGRLRTEERRRGQMRRKKVF